MSDIKIDDVLSQLKVMSKQAGIDKLTNGSEVKNVDFGDVLKKSIDHVHEAQQKAGASAVAFQKGDVNTELSEVMIEMQKARVSFEALSQVRNRLVSAYQEIMNMPV